MEKIFKNDNWRKDGQENIEISSDSLGVRFNLTDEKRKTSWVNFSLNKAKKIRKTLDLYIANCESEQKKYQKPEE